MGNFSSITVVIPSFCPPVTLPDLVKKLHESGFVNIIIINDGSPPEYELIFKEARKYISDYLVLDKNQGKGGALKHVFKYILKNLRQTKYVLTCDDDGQHDPVDVKHLAQARLNDTHAGSVWLGVRSFDGQVPIKSLIGNTLARYFLMAFTRKRLQDTQTGLRCLPVEVLENLTLLPDQRFDFETVSLLRLIQDKVIINELPIQTIYFVSNKATRFRMMRDSASVVKALLKYPKK